MNRIINLAVFHLGETKVERILTDALESEGVDVVTPKIYFYTDWIERFDYKINHVPKRKLTLSDIQSTTRNKSVVTVRHVLHWWVDRHYKLTLKETANFVCGDTKRHHTTVLHSIQLVNDFLLVKDKLITEMTESIEKYTLTREKRWC